MSGMAKLRPSLDESPKGLIWDLDGWQIQPWQAANYLSDAGFLAPGLCAIGVATMMAESNLYQLAWHLNVRRNEDGTILRDGDLMYVQSADLGWIQRNTPVDRPILAEPNAAQALVDELFETVEWDKFIASAKEARRLWLARGFAPWVANTNGAFRAFLPQAALGVGRLACNDVGLPRDLLKISSGSSSLARPDMLA